MTYPPAPWQMRGQLWLSLFRVREGDHPDRAPGLYGAALVSYEDPSPLTYSELLVARPVRADGKRHVEICDIWVDSVDSRDGGRELWAIPKDLCDFERTTTGGRVRHTSWATSLDGVPIASARFSDVSHLAPRTPFKGATRQVRQPVGAGAAAGTASRATPEVVVAELSGSARALPCRGSWDFDAEGPLAWLAGKRPLASFRMNDFSLAFG
jgi:acetoacetate decarboxylase